MSAEYETVAATVDAEIEVSRSRFLARLARAADETAAREVIAAVRDEHPRARHHATAFVLGPGGGAKRSNDDGEPSGTAGAPMLDALVAAGLSDVVAVVTRYFGGVLLGAGGLTRAYRSSVAEAILRAARVRRGLRRSVIVRAGYDVAAQIEGEARRRGFGIADAEYGERVAQRFLVAEGDVAVLAELAAAASSGSAEVMPGAAIYVDL